MRLQRRDYGESFLNLEAGPTGTAGLRHEGAKRAFIVVAVMGKLPGFHRSQGDGQPRGFAEGAFIVPKKLRIAEGLD
jgi:hypothetical protein